MTGTATWIAIISSFVSVASMLINVWLTVKLNNLKFEQDKTKIDLEAAAKARAETEKRILDQAAERLKKIIASVTTLQKYRDYLGNTMRNARIGDIISTKSVTDTLRDLRQAVENSYADLVGYYPKEELKFFHDAKSILNEIDESIAIAVKGLDLLPKMNGDQLGAFADMHRQLSSVQEELRTLGLTLQVTK